MSGSFHRKELAEMGQSSFSSLGSDSSARPCVLKELREPPIPHQDEKERKINARRMRIGRFGTKCDGRRREKAAVEVERSMRREEYGKAPEGRSRLHTTRK